jgi:hypothetical protein
VKQVPQPLVKYLAVILSLCLMAPAGNAMEATDRPFPAQEGSQLTGAANVAVTASTPSPNRPQSLSQEELQELSSRAEDPGPAVVGGSLSNLHLTYIVIALAAAVIVLIAVN